MEHWTQVPSEIIWHIVFSEIFFFCTRVHSRVCVERWHVSQTQENILREDWCALNWLLSSSIALPEAVYRFPPFVAFPTCNAFAVVACPTKTVAATNSPLSSPPEADGTPTAFRATSQSAILRNSALRSLHLPLSRAAKSFLNHA